MQITVLTLFPELIKDFLKYGIIKKSISEGLVNVEAVDLRDFCENGQVDHTSFGGGPGMVVKADPVKLALDAMNVKKSGQNKVMLLSPQGKKLDQKQVKLLAELDSLILIAGRYEGFDERISMVIDEEVSVGDFVTNGGEAPAFMMIEGIVRYLPGVLGDADSLLDESFSGELLDHPHFTKPRTWLGKKVPKVLLSGNHLAIKEWRREQRLINTFNKRPDLLKLNELSTADKLIMERYFFEINKQ